MRVSSAARDLLARQDIGEVFLGRTNEKVGPIQAEATS